MAENTAIEWTDHTVNFWWGCTKVGPGCDHCYAEAWDKRTGGDHWGPRAPRRWIKGAAETLRKINRTAPAFHAKHGRWPRVFLHSMSDLFDNEVPEDWRRTALFEIGQATNTRPQLVTKRIGNVEAMLYGLGSWPDHVGLLITVCNQDEADRDIPKLLDLKARLGIPWVGLSIEPMLGPVDLTEVAWHRPDLRASVILDVLRGIGGLHGPCGKIDWVICGGESGPHARPMHPDWPRSLRDQCQREGVPFLFKQWGEWLPYRQDVTENSTFMGVWAAPKDKRHDWGDHFPSYRIGKRAAGRMLDGRTWDEVPHA